MSSSHPNIDWGRVESAVLQPPSGSAIPLSYEYSDVKEMIVAATEKWLYDDLQKLRDVEVEKEFRIQDLGAFPVRGFIDLLGTYKRGEYSGSVLVADWKTSEGDLDTNWQNRLIASFQWKLYALTTGAEYISYRGINYKSKTREVYIRVADHTKKQVTRQFQGVSDMIYTLADSGARVWPQKMPSSCGAYNQTCVFKGDCDNETMPQYSLHPSELTLSYSGQDRFLLCPEKFRRTVHAEGDGGNDNTRLGQAFHRGMEEIYRQTFNLSESK